VNAPNHNSPSPYLAFFGLAREPFGRDIEDDLFYPEATRKQRLDLLLHLTQYGKELLLVTGRAGSGKSALLGQFAAKALGVWSVARLDAEGGMDERKLVQQLFRELGLDFQGATHGDLLERLTHHLDGLAHSARQGVMLIDNAQCLPVTALKRVLEFAALANRDDKPLLRVILFGEPELEQKLDDPLLERHRDLPRRSLDLPPFSEEESIQYVLHRLSAARFAAGEPFTDAVLRKLHRQSGGWPGRLNELARNILLNALPATPAPPIPGLEGRSYRRPGQLIAGGVVAAIIIALLWFQDTINQYFQPEKAPVATAPQQNQPLALPPVVVAPAPAETPAPEPVTVPAETPVAAAPPDIQPPSPETVEAPTSDKPNFDDALTHLVEDNVPAPAMVAADDETPAIFTPEPVETSEKTEIPAKPEPVLAEGGLPTRREAWLLQQSPAHYTLQLVAGERRETIEKFIREHKPDGQLALYQTTRNGKPWYGLVSGIYADKQQAIDARSRLPAPLRSINPWIRPLADVHKDLQ